MSKMHKEKITCPKCGKEHEFTARDMEKRHNEIEKSSKQNGAFGEPG